MKIFLLISLIILFILIIGKKVFYSAKRNLFKDHAAWSAKDIKIKHNYTKAIPDSKGVENYLKIIADESKNYLEEQSQKD